MSRIVFITDQHLCMASRWEETQRLMAWCEQKFAELCPDAIAFGGDLFDRAPSVEEVRTAAEWIRRLSMIAPVVGVTGNHDPRGLSVFDMVAPAGRVHFADAPEVCTVGGVDVVLLPWPRKAQLLAMLPDASAEQARQVGVEQLLNVVRGLGERTSDRPRCFVGHVQIRGAKVSTGQPLAPGADFELGWADLGLARCDAYLLGHIHLPDEVSVGGAPACYGGSFRRTAWGEVEEKSVVVVDFADGAARMWREPIPCTAMLHIEAQWCEEHVGLPGDVLVPAGLFFHGGRKALPDVSGAEVRVRYMVESDRRDAAKADAQAFRSELLARGAVGVKLEEEVVATSKARAPQVAAARGLAQKLDAFWDVRGTTPAAERAETLRTRACELESALGSVAASGSGALRLERLRVRNVGPFKGEHELDITSLPGLLVAVTGENGAGKSTTLELLAGALYRECPTRGSLASLATARDGMVEVTVVNGARHRVRQHVDAVSGKGEGAIFDAAGAPLIDSAKVRELDAWVAQHMPAPSVLYAGQFAPQGRRGLLDLKASERKALIAEMLGVQHLEQLAKGARARADEAKTACAATRARIDELPRADRDAMADAVLRADELAAAAGESARAARRALERAKAAAGDVARAIELYERRQAVARRVEALRGQLETARARRPQLAALIGRAPEIRAAIERDAQIGALLERAQQRPALEAEAREATAAVEQIQAKISNNRRVIEREAEIRGAVQALQDLQTKHAEAQTAARDAAAALESARAAAHAASTARTQAGDTLVARSREVADWREAMTGAQAVRDAVAQVAPLTERVEALRSAVSAAEAELGAQDTLRLEGKDRRISGLRTGLAEIRDESAGHHEAQQHAANTLSLDDELSARLASAPRVIEALRVRITEARAELRDAETALANAERQAARLPDVERVEAAHRKATAEMLEARAAVEAAERERERTAAVLPGAEAALARAKETIRELADQTGPVAEVAKLAGPLDNARARLEELAPALDGAEGRVRRARDALDALPEEQALISERAAMSDLTSLASELAAAPAVLAEVEAQAVAIEASLAEAERELAGLPDATPERPADLAELERAAATAEARAHELYASAAQARSVLAGQDQADARRTALASQLAREEAQLADWARLGQDLGRDGLQAAEIDAAIPEINEIANELLHTCHGSRFTVELRTDRLSADGKRVIEALDVRVIDTERGRDALAETFSGGECVIVGEALALALTTIACRGRGERPTLVRDESGAALSPDNARAYVAMLRRAAGQIGADKVLLVSHSPEVQEMCDARVRIHGGSFEVAA